MILLDKHRIILEKWYEYFLLCIVILTTYYTLIHLYVEVVYPIFNFGSMSYDPRDNRLFEISLLLITAIILPSKVKAPSNLYNWIYFIILIIPSSVLSSEQGTDRYHFFLMVAALWILLLSQKLFSILLKRNVKECLIFYRHLPYYSILLFIIVVLLLLVFAVHGVFNLNLSKVYELRFDITENMPLMLRYLLPLSAISFSGYLSALAIQRKDFKVLFLIIILGLLFFGFSSHKAMLFYPITVTAGYYLFKMSRPHLLLMVCLIFISIITIVLTNDEFKVLGSMFANRTIFIPSQINFYYFDYFSNNPHMLWAESKTSFGLIDSELSMGVMYYIGGLMTGNYGVRANTGWVANAYMNANVIGIALYATIISIIYSFIDYWSKIFGKQLVGAAFLIPITTFIMSADLLITLVTSGLVILLFIFLITTSVFLLRRPNLLKDKREVSLQNV